MIDLIFRKDENYYPKVFLENYDFNDYVEIYLDEEYCDDSDEKIQMNKIKYIDLHLEKRLIDHQSSRNTRELVFQALQIAS